MTKTKRTLIHAALWTGILLVLSAVATVLLTHILNTDAIRSRVAAELAVHYNIRAEKIRLRLLPFPRLALYGVRATAPETFTSSAETVLIYPRILPLFAGKFTPADIRILNPTLTAMLAENEFRSYAQRLLRITDLLPQLQAMLITVMPGVAIDVRNGDLELYSGQERAFFFEEIDLKTSAHSKRIDFELTSGKSNLWRALTLGGWLDPTNLSGGAELNLTGGNPGGLIRYLTASDKTGDSQIDLSLTVSTGGAKSARAEIRASVQQFVFDDGCRSIALSNGDLVGAWEIDANGLDLSISHFQFENPRLNFTASYTEKFSGKGATLDIDGRETDVSAVHKVMLAVDKDDPVVHRVFEIIRKAEIPTIRFSARANKPSDLMKLENYTIKASIDKGVVFAPKADLLVSSVSGNLLVEGGILSATNLSGKTARSSTNNGELKIGLRHEDPMFHLDLPITADISELPDVLNRVVNNQAFRRELARIRDLSGNAQGRLTLGENLNAVTVKVETGPFHLSGRYERLPQPVELSGASFLLDGKKLSVTSVAGKSGNSSLKGMDIRCDWGEANTLEIDTQAGFVAMEHLGPYLRAHEYWESLLYSGTGNPSPDRSSPAPLSFDTPKGSLRIDSFRCVGPLRDRSKWVFDAKGQFENVVFYNRRLDAPLTLKTGYFELDSDVIALRDVDAVLADSSLSVTGTISGYMDHVRNVDLQLSGRLGPEGNKVAASLAGLPQDLRAISGLSLRPSRLTWQQTDRKTAFKGELLLSSGPRIDINLVKTPSELFIEDLVIKDEDSDAAISIKSGNNEVEIGFSGTLGNKTADRLLINNRLLTGSIVGKFKTHLYLDTPGKSSAEGEVRVSGFLLPLNSNASVRIEQATIGADENKLNVKSAMISWDESRLSLIGNITVVEDAYVVDMNALADSFDLDSVFKSCAVNRENANGASGPCPETSKKIWELPVKGVIRVRSEHLTYGKIAWNPAEAEVVLDRGIADVGLKQANLCGISTPGSIRITPEGMDLSLRLSAKDQDLESSLVCLLNKKHIISGKYTLTGNISAKGVTDHLINSLEGYVELKAEGGRIFQLETLTKIISLLSISEIYRGVLPDLMSEGCGYTSLEAKGKIKNGKLVLSDSVLSGPCIKMVFHGEIDLTKQKMDVTALVAPLRTVERMVDATPLVGKVLGDAFVTLPVRISGDISDPSVVLLSPSAVGEELFGVMKRVFKLPLSIFQPDADKGDSNQ